MLHCRKILINVYELQKQVEKRFFVELFWPVSQRMQIHFLFTENVRILSLSVIMKSQKVHNLLNSFSINIFLPEFEV